jgi:hypothetical protein
MNRVSMSSAFHENTTEDLILVRIMIHGLWSTEAWPAGGMLEGGLGGGEEYRVGKGRRRGVEASAENYFESFPRPLHKASPMDIMGD